ncbi:MAG: type II toxin-antitoxin system VapC family toxin [Gaiellales bacterium]
MLVVDSSAAVQLALRDAVSRLSPYDPVAPPLLWSESVAALRQLAWRGDIRDEHATQAIATLSRGPIGERRAPWPDVYELGVQLGWAKTYDAEYVALALHLDCALLTVDARLARTAGRLIPVIPPEQI